MLLFGVAIFSYVMGNFLSILSEFKALVEDHDGAEDLNQFIQVLKRFNGNISINQDFQERIERFFVYKWKHDRN